MKFNQEQQKAIELTNKNIVVSASAGAGKTTVLIGRLEKRLFTDHLSLDEIVAVTFTEAAANEMKKRLSYKLNARKKEAKTEEELQFCHQQLMLLENANISTIHAFCLNIIKKHYASINIDPSSLKPLESHVLNKLKEEAFLKVVKDELTYNANTFMDLCNYMQLNTHHLEPLKEGFETIFKVSRNTLDPMAWYKEIIYKYKPIYNIQEMDSSIIDPYINDLNTAIKKLVIELICLLDILNNYNVDVKDIETNLEALKTCTIHLDTYQQDIDQLTSHLSFKVPTARGKADYKKQRDIVMCIIKDIVASIQDEDMIVKIYNTSIPYNRYLTSLARLVDDHYQHLKRQAKGIDFDDMEHLCYKVLIANNYQVSNYYKNKFKEVMVDEFQDTNHVQDAIINLVGNNNIFRVGDVKQSIYKFRGAKPSIMQSLLTSDDIEPIFIRNNYRSNKRIVDFNNLLFSQLLNIDGLSIQYNQLDCQIAELPQQAANQKPVEFLLLQKEKTRHSSLEKKEKEEESIENKEAKIFLIINKIKEIKEQDYQTYLSLKQDLTLFEPDTKEYQYLQDHINTLNYRWKDFCILLRGHADKALFKRLFKHYNIPCYIDENNGYLQCASVLTIISYLRVLVDPTDEIALVSLLTSPLYDYSEDDLAKMKHRSFSIDRFRNEPIYQDYQYLKELVKEKDLVKVIGYILSINDYYNDALTIQEKSNIDVLLSMASQYIHDSIFNFLAYFEEASKEKGASASYINNEDDVVNVMTIHHSKGLQFGCVFLYSTTQNTNYDIISKVLVDDELGVALSHYDESYTYKMNHLLRRAIIHRSNLEEYQEYLRILYVALTRAKHRLLIVDLIDNDIAYYPLTMDLIQAKKGFTTLIYLGLLSTTEETNTISKAILDKTPLNELCNITIIDDIDFPEIGYEDMEDYTIEKYQIKDNQKTQRLAPSSLDQFDLTLNLKEQVGFKVGSMIHKAIELLPNQIYTKEMIDTLNFNFTPTQIEKLIRFSMHPITKSTHTKTIIKEFPFYCKLEGNLIHGYMDYIAIGDTITLIDHKTDSDVTKEILLQRYQSQIQTYKKVLFMIYKKPVESYIYSFYLEEFIAV